MLFDIYIVWTLSHCTLYDNIL